MAIAVAIVMEITVGTAADMDTAVYLSVGIAVVLAADVAAACAVDSAASMNTAVDIAADIGAGTAVRGCCGECCGGGSAVIAVESCGLPRVATDCHGLPGQ